jgi:hypothetical protein
MRDLGANEGLFLLTDNMIPQLKEDYGTPVAGDLTAAEKRANFKRRILLRRRIDRR